MTALHGAHRIAITAALGLACAPAFAALVINGDFESGNSGFTSGHAFVPYASSAMLAAGETRYTVGTAPLDTHAYWVNPAGSTGNMLIVNGATAPDVLVWQQTITGATAGTPYSLSASFADIAPCCGNPASVRFSVDGSPIGAANTVNSTAFAGYETTFTAPAASFTLALYNSQTAAYGNDFAVDNVQVAAVPEPHEWAMMLAGLGLVGWVARRRGQQVAAA